MTMLHQGVVGEIKVLVAEDDELNRLLIGKILDSHKIAHQLVQDGLQAVLAFERESFDVVLLDLRMPVMGGVKAAERIRKLGRVGGVHPMIVALSGSDSGTELVEEGHFDEALEKPFSREQLVAILKRRTAGRTATGPDSHPFTGENLEEIREKIDRHPDFYAELLVQFEIVAREHLLQIATLIQEGSMKEALKITHILKGEIAIFDAIEARDTLEYLESLIQKNRLQTAGEVLESLGRILDDQVAVISRYIEQKKES